MLNLKLENAKFVKNDDNTYTVYQKIGGGILVLPKCRIELKAEALKDVNGQIFRWIECGTKNTRKNDASKTTVLLRKIRRFFGVQR